MSTHSFIARRRKGAGLPVLSVLGWLLIALQLSFCLSPAAFAASTQSRLAPQPSQDVTSAGVSVVRLVVSYTATSTQVAVTVPKPGAPPTMPVVSSESNGVQCTGLGVLVANWKAQSNEQNTWILTDGALINPDEVTCTSSHSGTTKLLSIKVFFSSAYNPQMPPITITPSDVRCQIAAPHCNEGAALFSFNNDALHPFVDVATTNVTPEASIALAQSAASPGTATPSPTNAQHLLTPQRSVLTGDSAQGELGTPFVNAQGELTGMRLQAMPTLDGFTAATIKSFLNAQTELKDPQPTHVNPVHDNWVRGIKAYYASRTSDAHAAFSAAAAANPQFQAAQDLAKKTMPITPGSESGKPGATGGGTSTPLGGFSLFGHFISYLLLISLVGLGVLIVLLILASIMFGRARARRMKADKDYAEAERLAEIQEEQKQQLWVRPAAPVQQAAFPFQASPVAGPPLLPAAPELSCPSCGAPVQQGAPFCPTCHFQFVPSESELQSPAHTKQLQQSQQPLPPFAPVASVPHPQSSVAEFPTTQMSPSIADAPTMPGIMQRDSEKTLPYVMRQLQGNQLGFVVGTRSDPGIKRKYKPNEDSLFAAQGARDANASPQQFGLFVVADGMGGHANGQDASRLAIQTIVDYVLPKLTQQGELRTDELEDLVVEGIQHANKAVHQQNMEQRGDMGTTVTAALVVGTIAYIANVGDSRTYLYRPPEELKKITHDHSVVASLVDAGIIKPDDIYTHPKRNQIYRSLGEKPSVEIDSFTVHLQAGDKLLLCSDGLWDMVRDPMIEEVLKSEVPDPTMTGDALIQAALKGGGEDNVSVIVVNVTEASMLTGRPGIQLLAKPDSVHMPQL